MSKYSFSALNKQAQFIQGSTTFLECRLLYRLAQLGNSRGVIAEIGSFQGKSTAFLAGASKQAGKEKVYAIDPHKGEAVVARKFSGPTYQRFIKNLTKIKVRDWVVPLRKTSTEAFSNWRKQIRLIFIDGDHRPAAVKKDVISGKKYLIKGGYIALHDAVNPGMGPPKAIVDVLLKHKDFSGLGIIDTTFYCRKKPSSDMGERINWIFYSSAMKLIVWLLSISESARSRRLKAFIQQYLVKRWLKKILTSVTLFFNPKLNFNS